MDDPVEAVLRRALHDAAGGWGGSEPPEVTRKALADRIRRRKRAEVCAVAAVAAAVGVVSSVSLGGATALPRDPTALPTRPSTVVASPYPSASGAAPTGPGAGPLTAATPPSPAAPTQGRSLRSEPVASPTRGTTVSATPPTAPPGTTMDVSPVGTGPSWAPPATGPAPPDPSTVPASTAPPSTRQPEPTTTVPGPLPSTFVFDDFDSGSTVTVPVDALISLDLTACQGARWSPAQSSAPAVVAPESTATSTSQGSAVEVLRAVGPGRALIDSSAATVCMTSATLFRLTVVVTGPKRATADRVQASGTGDGTHAPPPARRETS